MVILAGPRKVDCDRHAVADAGGEHERLERRPALPATTAAVGADGEVHPGLRPVPSPDHGHHPPVVVERNERAGRIGRAVQRVGVDGVVGEVLEFGVERGVHPETAPQHLVEGVVVAVQQLLAHVLDVVLDTLDPCGGDVGVGRLPWAA